MDKINSYFSVPIFSDETLSWRANLLSFILNLTLISAFSVAILFSTLRLDRPIFALGAWGIFFFAIGARVLLQHSRISFAAILLLGFMALTIPFVTVAGNTSIGSVAITTFQILTIVMAGLLLGGQGAFGFLIITIALNSIVYYAEANSWYIAMIKGGLFQRWSLQFITYTAITTLLWLANRLIQESLSQAQHELAERIRIEEEREELIRELKERNTELTRFNYTVSHELKTPIVTIKGFLGSIERDLQNRNYERAMKDFLRVSNATDKMQETLFDLLELARIGHITNPPEKIALSNLAQEALEAVDEQFQIHSRNITVNIAPDLPIIYGDRVRLREVFENLISNAANYMGDQKSPLIEIGVRDGLEPIFFVKDNGIGIEPEYHTKIFGLFEKLDPASKGTGIGLTLIKRIIEMHGGEIWVESDGLGRGSTFCFTIPSKGESDG
jgi:signal transduction histidine kinase